MKRARKHIIRWLLILVTPATFATAQEFPDTNYAFYEGRTYSYIMEAPEGWVVDLENSYEDGFTAALYPEGESYFDAYVIIFIWIFKNDTLSIREFISADSLNYLRDNEYLEFRRSDSIATAEDSYATILETEDPGAESTIAAVGYIDAKTEIIIYELNISERMLFAEGDSKFREALTAFVYIRKED